MRANETIHILLSTRAYTCVSVTLFDVMYTSACTLVFCIVSCLCIAKLRHAQGTVILPLDLPLTPTGLQAGLATIPAYPQVGLAWAVHALPSNSLRACTECCQYYCLVILQMPFNWAFSTAFSSRQSFKFMPGHNLQVYFKKFCHVVSGT